MKNRFLKFAALLAALCLALTGCNLIAVDPLMQIAEDRAAVEDIYDTVLAEYDGGTVTVADIIYDFNTQWSYYYQLFAMYYGTEPDDATITALRDDCVDFAVQCVAQELEAQQRGIALTDEELAEVEQTVRDTYDSTYESFLAQMTDDTEEARIARTEYELYATGQDYDAQLAYQTTQALIDKLREQVDSEVAEPTEESIEEAYNQHVEDDETNYADNLSSFETAMTSGTLVTWMPEGYRTVKHILVIPDSSVLDPYTEKKTELDTLTQELETLNEELLAATDDDATADDGTAADDASASDATDSGAVSETDTGTADDTVASLQAQIAEQEAAIAAAEEELAPLAEACFADVQDTLDEIQARLDAGEDFQMLIDEYGEDPGMQNEPTATLGYYVCADSTTWDTAFRDAAMLLENVGDVSEPVLGMSGVHIIRYESDVTPGAVPLEDVRDELYDEALTTLREENYNALLEEWVAAINPVYHYDNWDPIT